MKVKQYKRIVMGTTILEGWTGKISPKSRHWSRVKAERKSRK